MTGGAEHARMTDDVYAALVCTLYRTLLPTFIMSVSFLTVGAWITYDTRDRPLSLLLLLGAAAILARIVVLLLYHRETALTSLSAIRAGQLERRFAIPYLCFALCFGLFTARGFAVGAEDHRLLIVGLLFGYGAGVAAGLSLRPWISVPSALIAISPAILTSFFLPGVGHWGVGLLTALFLAGGIESMLRRYQTTSKQFAMQGLLASVDRRDELTGLPNQVMMREQFNRITASTPGAEMIAVHRLTIHGIETVNDGNGYPAGDALLRAIAERLARLMTGADFAARLGGVEFAIVQPALLLPNRAEMLARDILAKIIKPYLMSGDEVRIGAHIGYALDVQQGADAERLLERARVAAQRAQSEARGVIGDVPPRWTDEIRPRPAPRDPRPHRAR